MDPRRTCVGCKKVRGKYELLRFVVNDNEEIVYDPEKRLNGRGAYLCRDKTCIAAAFKKRRFPYFFKRKVKEYTPEEMLEIVNKELSA